MRRDYRKLCGGGDVLPPLTHLLIAISSLVNLLQLLKHTDLKARGIMYAGLRN